MMIEEQIKAFKAGTFEFIIGNFLAEKMKNDPEMVNHYEINKRSIGECTAYITKVAEKRAVRNRAVMTDQEVYDLAIHYALDGIPEGVKVPKPKANVKVTASKAETDEDEDDDEDEPAPKPAPVPKKKATKPKKFESDQLTLF